MLLQNFFCLQIFTEHLVYVGHFAKYLVDGGKNMDLLYNGFHCAVKDNA